jgi:hypothetical protein
MISLGGEGYDISIFLRVKGMTFESQKIHTPPTKVNGHGGGASSQNHLAKGRVGGLSLDDLWWIALGVGVCFSWG